MSTLSSLPITAIKTEFCQALTDYHTLVLSAPPGAGKSTCLPLWLLSLETLSNKKIYLLQPRRLAVKNIATYLASQLNEPVGETVGYRLRNDTKTSRNTRLEVITEGILTQIIQKDPELENASLVIFDEFHERSLHGDLAFALTRDVQQGLRENLKILLMSATLDIEYLAKALPDAKVLSSEGRSYPITYSYNAPQNMVRWRDHAIGVIKDQMLNHQGSILVFLSGIGDIRYMANALEAFCPSDLLCCPLYGNLTLKQQQLAIQPFVSGKRKLVLATNIAETSLTIEGVNMVIDCGFEKVAIYDSASLMNKLTQQQIAKASAIQRAGRAGRLMPGHCIRLYAKDNFERRPEQSTNDIQQADLLPTIIEAARWGVSSLNELPLIELPSSIKETQAWQELQSLNIVNKNNKLTAHGEQVAQIPCHPRFAHMLLQAKAINKKMVLLGCMLTALLEEKDILSSSRGLGTDSNVIHRVEQLASQWHKPYGAIANIIKQVTSLLKSLNSHINNHDMAGLLKELPVSQTGLLLAYSYPERVAKARKTAGDYICANGKGVTLSEEDALAGEEFLVIADLMQFNNTLSVKLAASIELHQIEEIFSKEIVEMEQAILDESSGRIIARKKEKLGAITLSEKVLTKALSEDVISKMWCEHVRKKGLQCLNWQEKDTALIARWQWLTDHFPNYQLPRVSNETLLENLENWFSPFVGEIKLFAKLSKLDLSEMLLSQLDYQQQQILKQAAPTHYVGPTGRHCPITYSTSISPKVSMPMQELYGETETPSIGSVSHSMSGSGTVNKSIPLLLELISPAKRPIQVTQNLAQFWSGSYKAVQKDMKARYPRHYWPDDPVNAQPTNKTKRHLKNI